MPVRVYPIIFSNGILQFYVPTVKYLDSYSESYQEVENYNIYIEQKIIYEYEEKYGRRLDIESGRLDDYLRTDRGMRDSRIINIILKYFNFDLDQCSLTTEDNIKLYRIGHSNVYLLNLTSDLWNSYALIFRYVNNNDDYIIKLDIDHNKLNLYRSLQKNNRLDEFYPDLFYKFNRIIEN
jgi:hypothetical protein